MAKLLHTIDAILGVKDQVTSQPTDSDTKMAVLQPVVASRLWQRSGMDASVDDENGTTHFVTFRLVAMSLVLCCIQPDYVLLFLLFSTKYSPPIPDLANLTVLKFKLESALLSYIDIGYGCIVFNCITLITLPVYNS